MYLSRWAPTYSSTLFSYIIPDFLERFSFYPTRQWNHLLDVGSPTDQVAQALMAREDVDWVCRIHPAVQKSESARPIGFCIGDEEHLPVVPGSFCGAFSLLSLQGVSDLPGTLHQIRTSLKDQGIFLGCLLGGTTLTELRQSFAAAEQELYGGMNARVAPLITWRDLGDCLTHVGFSQPVIDRDTLTKTYPSPRALMEDLRRMGLANTLSSRSRTFMSQRLLQNVCSFYTKHFPALAPNHTGAITTTFEVLWFSARV
jgi:hypothetical protein